MERSSFGGKISILIKQYQAQDKEIILHFLEALQDYVINTDPIKRIRRKTQWGENYFPKLLKSIKEQKGKIYIAWDNKTPVGCVAGVVKKQTKENLLEVIPTSVGAILELFVKEKYRGCKIGFLLIQKMENYLKFQGCDSLWVEVFAPNLIAHNFYKKLGYVNREIGMLKRILS